MQSETHSCRKINEYESYFVSDFFPAPFCGPSTYPRQSKILWFCGAQVSYAAKYYIYSLSYLNLSSEAGQVGLDEEAQ